MRISAGGERPLACAEPDAGLLGSRDAGRKPHSIHLALCGAHCVTVAVAFAGAQPTAGTLGRSFPVGSAPLGLRRPDRGRIDGRDDGDA